VFLANDSHSNPARWKLILALASVYFIWGSTYLAILFAIETMPPFSMAAFRFILAGTILYVIARQRCGRPDRRHWFSATIVGALLLGGGNGSVVWAEQWVPSGLAALIIAITPIWMVIIDWISGGSPRPSKTLIAGLLWGLIGVGLLINSDHVGSQSREGLIGGIVLLMGSLAWALGSIYACRARLPESPWLTTAMQMLAGGAVLAVMAIIAGESGQIDPASFSMKSIISLIYLIIFGAVIGYSAYIWLLGVTTPAMAATYAYFNPLVAMFLGWLMADELIDFKIWIAMIMIISAIVLISLNSTRTQSSS